MKITQEILLNAYKNGYFPMSESRNSSELNWYSPKMRGIIPLENFHIPKSLKKFINKCDYEVRFNTEFEKTIRLCADVKNENRKDTWINQQIIELYCDLSKNNNAISVETWQNNQLIGGLYGVKIGKAFFGESMFSLKENASKFALVKLVDWLKNNGYNLLDTQYTNNHLLQFGCIEVPKSKYIKMLSESLK